MALLTTGAVAGGLGFVWKFWRIPVRLWQWHKAPEVEPEVGQTWREASLSGPNKDWKVLDIREEPWHIFLESTTDKDVFDDPITTNMDLKTWETAYIKKRRLYCKDTNDSLEDQYFGDSSEDSG